MKRIIILYIAVFLATLIIPLLSMIKPQVQADELITLFNGCIALLFSY